jgi:hypothetical protein
MWSPVHVLSPNKAGDSALQVFNIIFVSTVHAANLLSYALSCSKGVQKFADVLNPDYRYGFLLNSRIAVQT